MALSIFLGISTPPFVAGADDPGVNSSREEYLIHKEQDGSVKVTRDGAKVSPGKIQIEVISNGNSDPAGNDVCITTMVPNYGRGRILDPTPVAQLKTAEPAHSPSASTVERDALIDSDRKELGKWRVLSRCPVKLVIVGGVLNLEWAGARKAVPVQENVEISIQLSPQ